MAALWTYAGIDRSAIPLNRNIDIGMCAVELRESFLSLLFSCFLFQGIGHAFKSSVFCLCQKGCFVGPLLVL